MTLPAKSLLRIFSLWFFHQVQICGKWYYQCVYTLENDNLSGEDEFDQRRTQKKRIWSKQILTAGLKNKARRRKGRRGGESPSLVVTMALQPVLAKHHSPRNKSTENGLNTDRPKKAPILALMVFKVHFAQMGWLAALWPLLPYNTNRSDLT